MGNPVATKEQHEHELAALERAKPPIVKAAQERVPISGSEHFSIRDVVLDWVTETPNELRIERLGDGGLRPAPARILKTS